MPSLTNPAFPAETLAMIRTSWSLYTRALATVIYPGAQPESLRWISDALRRSCTADYYASTVELHNAVNEITTINGTTGSNGVALLNYKLSKGAAAGTYGVQAATTVTGASATVGASTSFTVQ